MVSVGYPSTPLLMHSAARGGEGFSAVSPCRPMSFALVHVYLTGASPNGARQAEGKGRGEPVGGCGTLAIRPGLSIAEGCGQHTRPRAGAGSSDSEHSQGVSVGFLAMIC